MVSRLVAVLTTLALVLSIGTACARGAPRATPSIPRVVPTPTAPPSTAIINGHLFRLEVADQPGEWELGLGKRTSLDQDSGMLFIFPTLSNKTFWMKDTLIPLDVIFMDSNLLIVDIRSMEVQPGATDRELKRYTSSAPAQFAMEINGGQAQALGLKRGMKVELR